jgi:hypothetical protein
LNNFQTTDAEMLASVLGLAAVSMTAKVVAGLRRSRDRERQRIGVVPRLVIQLVMSDPTLTPEDVGRIFADLMDPN